MAETKFTPGPWVKREAANLGNGIYGPTGKRAHPGDDGYRVVGIYMDAIDSDQYADQEVNRAANGDLITAAPELYAMTALLERCLVYEIKKSQHDGDDEGARLKSLTLAQVRDVLAKARGE